MQAAKICTPITQSDAAGMSPPLDNVRISSRNDLEGESNVKNVIRQISDKDSRDVPAGLEVAVCVPTCRRPKMLRDCLASLAAQFPIEMASVRIIVIDNEETPSEGAMEAAAQYSALYFHEPRRGIPQARNRALTAAKSINATHVAFIDDDEIASPNWLASLWTALKEYGADAVQGPVHYIYPKGAAKWR